MFDQKLVGTHWRGSNVGLWGNDYVEFVIKGTSLYGNYDYAVTIMSCLFAANKPYVGTGTFHVKYDWLENMINIPITVGSVWQQLSSGCVYQVTCLDTFKLQAVFDGMVFINKDLLLSCVHVDL